MNVRQLRELLDRFEDDEQIKLVLQSKVEPFGVTLQMESTTFGVTRSDDGLWVLLEGR